MRTHVIVTTGTNARHEGILASETGTLIHVQRWLGSKIPFRNMGKATWYCTRLLFQWPGTDTFLRQAGSKAKLDRP